MWSWLLMRPGLIAVFGHLITVASTALAAQSQPTQAIVPSPATATWPPRITELASSTSPMSSLPLPVPGVTAQLPLGNGSSLAQTISGADFLQFGSQPSPGALLPSSHSSPGSGIALPHFGFGSDWHR